MTFSPRFPSLPSQNFFRGHGGLLESTCNKEFHKIESALRSCLDRAAPWAGEVFRSAAPKYAGTRDMTTGLGSAHAGGRWNPPGSFPTVYASLEPETAMSESLATFRYYGLGAPQRPSPPVPRHPGRACLGPGPPGAIAPASAPRLGGASARGRLESLPKPRLGAHLPGNRARSLHGWIGRASRPLSCLSGRRQSRGVSRPAPTRQPDSGALGDTRNCACIFA